MFQYFDTLIGFLLIILFFSVQVTALVQAFGQIFNRRAVDLRLGLEKLLRRMAVAAGNPPAEEDAASFTALANSISRHELLGAPSGGVSTIEPEDVTTVLQALQLAEIPEGETDPHQPALGKVLGAGENAGDIPATQPPKTLTDLLNPLINQAYPDQPEKADAVAIALTEPTWTGHLNRLFPACMKRSSEHFRTVVKRATFVLSFVMAFGLQIDSFDLLRQLTANPEAATALAEAAGAITAADQPPAEGEAAAATTAALPEEVQGALTEAVLAQGGLKLVNLEPTLADYTDLNHLVGMLVTGLLLGLGAPFWFNILKDLSSLRPTTATLTKAGEK